MSKSKFSFICVFVFICLFVNAQKKNNAIIKINGDTVWCEKAQIIGDPKPKRVECTTEGSVTKFDIKDVAFVILSDGTYIITDDHWNFGRILIDGKNYYLSRTLDFDTNMGQYYILDKNRKLIKTLKGNKGIFDQLKQYFNDCDEFIKDIDNAANTYDPASTKRDAEIGDLAKKYKIC